MAAIAIALLFFLTGCGVKGPPQPYVRKVPKPPGGLRAIAEVKGVRLSCEVPSRYTDDTPLYELQAIEFLRADIHSRDCPDCPTQPRVIGRVPYRYPEGSRLPKGKVEYLDDKVLPGMYVYRAVARTRGGVPSAPSAQVRIFWDVPPAAVEGLRAVAGDGRIEIDWRPVTRLLDGKPVEGVAYQVFRQQRGEAGTRVVEVADKLKEPHYVDAAVENGRAYVYRVRALRQVDDHWVPGEAGETEEVMPRDLTPPPPPVGLMAFPTKEYVRLTWEGSEARDVAGYNVYRAKGRQGPWRRLTDSPVRSVFFDDKQVARGETYWYAVTAVDDATPPNESGKSAPIEVSVP
jgi:hypothetical protein